MQEKESPIIIPRPKPKVPPWLKFIFFLSILFLISQILLGVYFLVKNNKTKEKIELAKNEIISLEKEVISPLSKKVIAQKKKFERFKELSKKRNYISDFLKVLEETTHPEVWFSEFRFDSKTKKVQLKGEAKDFYVLAQQLLIFSQKDSFEDISVDKMKLEGDSKVTFKIEFIFKQ